MKKRILAVLMVLVISLPFSVALKDQEEIILVSAESVQDKIDQAVKDKQDALDKMKAAEEDRDDIVAESEELELEIDLIQSEIFAIDELIAEAEEQIAEKEGEITELEEQIADQDEKFKECLRAMDETSAVSYIDLLLSSESISELLINLESINEMTNHDMAVIDEMTRLKNEVEQAKAEIELYREEQEDARELAVEKQGELEIKLAEKEDLIAELEGDIEKYSKVYEEARRKEEELKASLTFSAPTSEYMGTGEFCWPAPSYTRISSPYGWRYHPIYKTQKFHSGVDLAAPGGSNILAADDGKVISAGWNGGYGNCVVVDHGGGVSTLYAHASRLCVSKGDIVTRGQVIAKVGTTGNSTGNHLHFEVLINSKTTDPMPYIQ